jgi:hypothetical protein
MAAPLEPRRWPSLPDPLPHLPLPPRMRRSIPLREGLQPHRRSFTRDGGFVFLPTPGPSFIIIVIGLWMVAGELHVMARLFDRVEVRLRKATRWVKDVWARPPKVVKTLVKLSAASALLYGIYRLFFGG